MRWGRTEFASRDDDRSRYFCRREMQDVAQFGVPRELARPLRESSSCVLPYVIDIIFRADSPPIRAAERLRISLFFALYCFICTASLEPNGSKAGSHSSETRHPSGGRRGAAAKRGSMAVTEEAAPGASEAARSISARNGHEPGSGVSVQSAVLRRKAPSVRMPPKSAITCSVLSSSSRSRNVAPPSDHVTVGRFAPAARRTRMKPPRARSVPSPSARRGTRGPFNSKSPKRTA